jgi:hypothetical protein
MSASVHHEGWKRVKVARESRVDDSVPQSSVMARRPASDMVIIEVLDPDDPALLWSDAPSTPGFEPPRPPASPRGRRAWPWLLGTVAVLAVAWFVVLALADEPEPPKPPVVLADGRYLLDDPSLVPYSADIVAAASSRQVFRMWTDDGQAGARSVTVEAQQGAAPPFVATDVVVHEVAGVTLMASIADPSVVVAERDLTDGWHAVITTRGLSLEQAASVAQDVQVVTLATERSVELRRPQFGDVDLRSVAAGGTISTALFGDVASELHYLDEAGVDHTLRVAAGSVDDAASLLPFVADSLPSTIDGRVVGRLTSTGEGVVLWEDQGYLLSLTAPVDPSVLASSADRVRQATRDEWQGLLRGLQPDYRLGEATVVASGDVASGGWIAGAQRAQRGGNRLLLWWFSEPGDMSSVVSRPASPLIDGMAVDRFAIAGSTFVFVRLDPSLGDAAIVTWGTDRSVLVPLQAGYLDEPILMGVTRVDGPGDIDVQVIRRGFAAP